MIVYKCILSGAELFSDSCIVKEIDGLYQVKGGHVTVTKGHSGPITGANKSAEDNDDDDGDDDSSKVTDHNIVVYHDLKISGGDIKSKADLGARLKDKIDDGKGNIVPMGKLFLQIRKEMETAKKTGREDSDIQAETTKAASKLSSLLKTHKNMQPYIGKDFTGTLGFLIWETPDDGGDDIPYFYFIKEHVKEEKC